VAAKVKEKSMYSLHAIFSGFHPNPDQPEPKLDIRNMLGSHATLMA
jgi:hypothetical protein